jgi:carbon monoxide dehydrogenase subunit G
LRSVDAAEQGELNMEMQGQRRLPVEQALVWSALNDPEVLKACVPGCERFEVEAENAYTVVTALKIGPVSARFTGKVRLSDVTPPQSYTLGFEGQGGVAGFGKGTSAVRLEPADGGCELHYTVSATVGGKIAQLGQRLIDGVARSLADDFFKRFEAELLRRHPAAPNAEPAAAEPAAVEPGSASPAPTAADPAPAAASVAPEPEPAPAVPSQSDRPDRQASRESPGGSSRMLWVAAAIVAALVVAWLAR